jgi:RNA polymerase sigma-70 factor (ECF subfamily)
MDFTELLGQLRSGDEQAAAKLLPLVYNELRSVASRYLRKERSDHTLQPTALVHETYLRLVREDERNWRNRAHFIAVAAHLMRQILVDHARGCMAEKRIPRKHQIPIEDAVIFSPERSEELLALDDALTRLHELSERQARIVELRFFGGLSVEETAEVIGISPKTVKRDWSVARAWLHGEIHGE